MTEIPTRLPSATPSTASGWASNWPPTIPATGRGSHRTQRPLDAGILRACAAETLAHCPALNMRFEFDGETLWQRPQSRSSSPSPALARPERRSRSGSRAEAWMRRALAHPCNPAADPLYRSALLQLGAPFPVVCANASHRAGRLRLRPAGQGGGRALQRRAARTGRPPLPNWRLEPVLRKTRPTRRRNSAAGPGFWTARQQAFPAATTLAPRSRWPMACARPAGCWPRPDRCLAARGPGLRRQLGAGPRRRYRPGWRGTAGSARSRWACR
ncbi:Uncharacterised protein [Chromobacterium violaceum]|uniref:Uncharacterized protein n=1 Tax=Chromobacterium violaceum TaxID=536 RepID=A0A447T9R1_CHRVL|nr:Uncharacterised protein [Chromobacterium violaceum]